MAAGDRRDCAPTAASNAAGACGRHGGSARSVDRERRATTPPAINSTAELQAFASSFRTVTAAPTAAGDRSHSRAAATPAAPRRHAASVAVCHSPNRPMLGPSGTRGTAAVVVRDNSSGEVRGDRCGRDCHVCSRDRTVTRGDRAGPVADGQ